ncbi:DUF3883 domain-containing protein [Methylophaga sp.]|uniref:sacsin N-terminal ATP-binding-like domain-containing protein n=1 Tax=Methylophaga sp. TaxID=2024840 RepID=UPI0025F5E2E3|nr:DUF3883 domain-containing protein [Methylophaga sp.]
MKKFLEEAIEEQVETYKSKPKRMISDYNREKQNIADYNGRQLMELIQNADDQGADKVSIKLDTKTKELLISNTGLPFSETGYESLMLSNLSPKTEERFIGNKGLGFRSVVNWSEEVVVISNGLDIKFSPAIARKYFESTFNGAERKNILASRNLSAFTIPWPVMSTPAVTYSENFDSPWSTEIEIHYLQKYESDIHKQIECLRDEILLFLNNIDQITIQVDETVKSIKRTVEGDVIKVGECRWRMYSTGIQLLPEFLQDFSREYDQHYNLTIALPEQLHNGSNYLYSYFPTKIQLDFPFIVHGTFDLDSSRNQLNQSEKNIYLLSRLVELMVDVAKDVSSGDVTWEAFKVLTCSTKNTVLEDLNFFSELELAKSKLQIYPCIDESYRCLEEVHFKTNNFSTLVFETGGAEYFPALVKSSDDRQVSLFCSTHINKNISRFVEKVNAFSSHLLGRDVEHRITLIRELITLDSGEVFDVLINKNTELLNADRDDVFTPLSSNIEKLDLPKHVKIEFIDSSFYLRLIDEFALNSYAQKARELQRKLKLITNIHSYEPAELITKIITSTNKIVREQPQFAKKFTQETVFSLYRIFIQLEEPPASKSKLSLINTKGEIVQVDQLHFGGEYPCGEYVEKIFHKIYGASAFLAKPQEYLLENEDTVLVERFFIWLGVATFVRYHVYVSAPMYLMHLNEINNVPRTYRGSLIRVEGINPDVLDSIVNKCDLEEIVLWLFMDKKAQNLLFDDQNHNLKYSLRNERYEQFRHSYTNTPSYLQFQFLQKKFLEDYWINDDASLSFINSRNFDYDYFNKLELGSKEDINRFLKRLGGSENFVNLPAGRINEIVRQLPEHDPQGKQTQKVYKLVLEHYRVNGVLMKDSAMLFARTGDTKGYYQNSQVYYSDNVRLPKKIIAGLPILNIPKRQGADQVKKLFQVNDMSDLKLEIISHDTDEALTHQFEKKFNKIKPFILSYRLENVQKQKNREAKALSRLSVKLCNTVKYIYQSEEYYLDDFDYLENKDGLFLVKVTEGKNLESISSMSEFGDTFAEVVSSAFRVNDHRLQIRSVLRNDLSDTEHLIRNELGNEILVESRYLLGISDYFVSFWTAISKALDRTLSFECKRENSHLIAAELGLEVEEVVTIKNVDFESDDVSPAIALIDKLHIDIKHFNKKAYYKLSLSAIHKLNLQNTLNKHQKTFRYLLWLELKGKSKEKKSKFNNSLCQYDHLKYWLEELANKHTDTAIPDYFSYILEKVKREFNIDLSSDFDHDLTAPDLLYQENIQKVGNFDNSDIPSNVLSLLYFEDTYLDVKAYIDALSKSQKVSAIGGKQSLSVSLPKFSKSTRAINYPYDVRGKKRPGRFSTKLEAAKRESGAQAEALVFSALENEFGKSSVDHVSLRDDSLGYDIRYTPDSGKSWKYVEVKKFSNNHFKISKNEYKFSREHMGDYELFLVNGEEEISIIKEVDFTDEGRFLVESNEYIVMFDLIDT